MFFIIGVDGREKQLDFDQTVVCSACGRYGHISVWVAYTCLSFFFIPLFKWNRRYFIRMGCCGRSSALEAQTGRAIERGEITNLDPAAFSFADPWSHGGYAHRCAHCGYETDEDFQFCPKCGRPLS